MKTRDQKKKGSVTVEAAIVMPIYILVICFVLNLMNLFYIQTVIQMGLNNIGSTMSQYVYAVDLVTDVDKLALDQDVTDKAKSLASDIGNVKDELGVIVGEFSNFSLSRLGVLFDAGRNLVNSVGGISTKLKDVKGDDIMNALIAGAVDVGGGAAVSAIMDDYMDAMRVNRNCLDGPIHFFFGLDGANNSDIILTATYQYKDPLVSAFIGSINLKQSVVVHPWIGGNTPGLRQK